ncbi:hypothetical protein V8E54_012742 [Elaphomyces granulatus]|jgi:hypothetical protein
MSQSIDACLQKMAVQKMADHIPNLDLLVDNIDNAITSSFPPTQKLFRNSLSSAPYSTSPYKSVHALLLSWENDDLGVSIVEIEKLQKVLLEKYRYDVDKWEIPMILMTSWEIDSENSGSPMRRWMMSS